MKIERDHQGAITVCCPDGPITEPDAQVFRRDVMETFEDSLGRFVLDVKNVTFVDSAGLEALLDVTEHMEQSGQALKLCTVHETLRQVLDLTGLAEHFEYFEDANAAARSFL